ncbi:class II aldolase/adducin family protein, partial [Candidatus Woesearchaeota archaeon]|nr:class II aldolase/adducin family protein [Candidatus Woesearchaeota archaeon]
MVKNYVTYNVGSVFLGEDPITCLKVDFPKRDNPLLNREAFVATLYELADQANAAIYAALHHQEYYERRSSKGLPTKDVPGFVVPYFRTQDQFAANNSIGIVQKLELVFSSYCAMLNWWLDAFDYTPEELRRLGKANLADTFLISHKAWLGLQIPWRHLMRGFMDTVEEFEVSAGFYNRGKTEAEVSNDGVKFEKLPTKNSNDELDSVRMRAVSARFDSFRDVGKKCDSNNWVPGGAGNLTERLDNGMMLVTGSGCELGDLKREDLVLVEHSDLEKGGVAYLDKGVKPTSETLLHARLYEVRPDFKAIVHAHAKGLTFYTRPSPITTGPIFDYGTKELAVDTALFFECLPETDIAIIRGHGVVAGGHSLDDALRLISDLDHFRKEDPNHLHYGVYNFWTHLYKYLA